MASSVFYPAASTDTGYWFNNGGWFSSTGYNGRTAAAGNYSGNRESAWARFQNVAIPQGATITSAILRLTSNGNHTSKTIALSVRAELADSPHAPSSVSDANGRTKTDGVNWSPGDWTTQAYDSPDIASVIQEVVDRTGWTAGNALQIFVLDNGSSSGAERAFYCFGNGTGYPELHVVWQESSNVVSVTCGWSILASTQVGSSWRNMAETTDDTAWRVLDKHEATSGWRIFARRSTTAAWHVMAAVTAALSWHILARQTAAAAWRVFGHRVQAMGWRVLAGVKIGSGWRIYAGQQVASSWRVMTGLSHSSAWRVLASSKTASGWRILRQLVRAIGWRIGEVTDATGTETIRLQSPICREMRAESPITRLVRLQSKVW
ncbi:hypothetical protein K9F62_02985 [Desulfovibrio sp. JY]|nr:hypothetical protein K9F62_02985 [Desulfovibrio sp. JY]